MEYKRPANVQWPMGKKFAFSIFDDTDNATVQNIRPVYNLFGQLGIRITKSVWPLRSDVNDKRFAHSLEDPEYLDFILELQHQGHEIGYHGARAGDNPRELTKRALDLFAEKMGHDPYTYSQHSHAIENLYWGSQRTLNPGLPDHT